MSLLISDVLFRRLVLSPKNFRGKIRNGFNIRATTTEGIDSI